MISKKASNILRVAFRALARNKLRSLLTALGIIIGVACVVAVVGIGEGARIQSEDRLKSLGTNFLMVLPGSVTSGRRPRRLRGELEALGGRRRGDPEGGLDGLVRLGLDPDRRPGHLRQPELVDVHPGRGGWSWPLVRSWNIEKGMFFTEQDDHAAAKVCVLGQTVVANLFGDEDPIGKTIRIKNIPFRVVGVLESKGGSTMGQDQDDLVVAPYETVRKKVMGTNAVGQILVSATTNDLVGRAQEEIEPPPPEAPDQQVRGPGRRLHHPVADGDARAGRGAEPHDERAPLVDRGSLAPRRRDRDHEHHARLRHGADARDRRPHGDRRQGGATSRRSSSSRPWRSP